MASHAPDYGRASALPLSAVLESLPSYPRPVIEHLVARLIDHMDEQDGEPDLELAGDEADGTDAEDEVGNNHLAFGGGGGSGPGCQFSDPGEDENDAEPDNDGDCGEHGLDQRAVVHWGGTWRAE